MSVFTFNLSQSGSLCAAKRGYAVYECVAIQDEVQWAACEPSRLVSLNEREMVINT